jgi:uncharacterized protein YkwD
MPVTHVCRTFRPMRKLLALMLFFLLGLGGLPASAGVRSDEADFVNRINALRASQGVAKLRINAKLTSKARNWAGRMAAQDRIWHSKLSDGVPANWQKLGENVGMGGSVADLHEAFVKSPRHYDNLVDPVFRDIGLGVVTVNGKTFVSEVFRQRRPNRRAPPRRTWKRTAGARMTSVPSGRR